MTTSTRPYLLRAFYQWITDNHLTPHVMVNADYSGVKVPSRHVEKGRIILNIDPVAVDGLVISNTTLEFDASFDNVITHLTVPCAAILAIYAKEGGQGMAFPEQEFPEVADIAGISVVARENLVESEVTVPSVKPERPHLRIVKPAVAKPPKSE